MALRGLQQGFRADFALGGAKNWFLPESKTLPNADWQVLAFFIEKWVLGQGINWQNINSSVWL